MVTKRIIKYAIHPNHVKSIHDRQERYISFMALIRCYRIHQLDCLDMSPTSYMSRGYSKEFLDGLIHLYPRPEGDYQEYLEEQIKKKEESNG